jgi:hypothetical protein
LEQHNSHLLNERVVALEIEVRQYKEDVHEIREKLDALLDLKHKGAGALWVISLVVGSGLLGLVATIVSYFSHPHL